MQQDFESNKKWQILNVTAKKLWLGEKKKKTLYTLFVFFFFENFGFAVDEWWYNNYNNKNISIYIAAFARGCKVLLPIITVSGKLSQPASQSYSFTEGCYWPSAHLILAYFPWPIAPWCAQVDEAIEINASFRLAWRLPLRHLIIACSFRVSALSGHAALVLSPNSISSELSAVCRCG